MKQLAALVLVAGIYSAPAQAQGIRPLTAATFQEAQQVPDLKATLSFASPMTIVLQERLRTDPNEARRLFDLIKDPPFSFMVSSPYGRVAEIAIDAKRKYSTPQYESIDVYNARLVQLTVSPGSSITTADAIENVIIKRGADVIRPLKTDVHPTTVETRMGLKKQLSEGTFTFDFSAFDPSTGITLVLIGSRGNFEWEMRPNELAKLR